ncbi:uncharacterized protein LOC111597824 [Drosophila hydei]|uniref:Uncharacterized protein LOC111597824 n=1 Tax=Drosophila hydei TaxID=7224 RepID=A0A6J1LQL7_DROHY|nr:uncharacterized protein LOC111597824 [Drosophila hydei]
MAGNMYRTCLCLIALLLGIACAASPAYIPRQTAKKRPTQSGAYYYNPPSPATMAALRRIIQGHLQRFQLADRQRAQQWQQGRVDMQLQPYRKQQPAGAPTHLSFEFAVPPNTPTPKNYAMNFLPEGKDVAPGTSYIPLKLLRIRR